MKAVALLAGLLVALAASPVRPDDLPEWQDPAVFERGQEPGAAPLMSLASTEEALQHAPKRYNPVGSYRTDFELPAGWDHRRLLLHFEGVQSADYFWLNGAPLGYNEGGMEPAEFDVSAHARPGRNTLAVRVLRWSDGSYLEAQDMWRLSGIFRDVYLRATPTYRIFGSGDAVLTSAVVPEDVMPEWLPKAGFELVHARVRGPDLVRAGSTRNLSRSQDRRPLRRVPQHA